ncbi:MAG: cell envelope integrity EipB family protein [Azospirillaceae bacterium]|nr:cell envelope integrity EipB family protein [Azospirillaceae bacterium]
MSRRTACALVVITLSGVLSGPLAMAAPPAPTIEIVPHRALYDMSLASTRGTSNVADVGGQMLFEWADACDGWTVEQRFRLQIVYSEGETSTLDTSVTSWEAKDGLSYRFNVRRKVTGEADELIRGQARLSRAGGAGEAIFTAPVARTFPLPAGTLFPSAHTIAVLQQAAAGDLMFLRPVFDGTDGKGAADVSAVISNSQKTPGAGLADGAAWPVRLAFFPQDGDVTSPETEMTLDLLSNGIARSMEIDYDDFQVSAKLAKVEAVPRPKC